MPPLGNKYFYTIRGSNGVSVQVMRGSAAPQITGGGAKWTTVDRPRRSGQIQWTGDDPYTMDLPVMFDGWDQAVKANRNVERDIQKVNNMLHSPGAWVQPVTIKLVGAVPVKGGTWVLTGIDYGDMVIWDTDKHGKGFRMRQDAVLHLLQYLPLTTLKFNRKPGTTTPYIVKRGDTVQSIAAKWYTTPAAIKKQNKIRDPKKIKVNDRLLIPPPSLKDVFGW